MDGFFGDLGGVNHAGFFEVDEAFFWGHDVDAVTWLSFLDFGEQGLRVEASVLDDVDEGSGEGALDNLGASGSVFNRASEIDERDAATGDDAFGESGLGGSYSVVDAELLFVDFGFGGTADLDDGDFAEESGGALLEFLALIVGFGEFGLRLDEGDAILDGGSVAGSLDDGGFVFGGDDLGGGAENFEADFFELHALVAGDNGGIGEDGDVFHDFFAAITEGRGFEDESIEHAFELVEDEDREGFAFDFFGDDDEIFAAGLSALLEERQEFVGAGDFLVGDEDERLLEDGFLAVGVGDEEGRGIAFVVGEAFDDFLLHFEALALLNGDDAVFADFADDVGDELADLRVASGDGGDFGDLLVVTGDFLGGLLDALDDFGASGLNAGTEFHGVDTGGDEFVGLVQDIVGEDGDGGGAIASDLVEFLSGGLDELGADLFAEVFVGGAEVNGFGDGDTVVGDGGGAVGFLDHDVLTFGAEGDLDGVVKLFGAGEDFGAGVGFVKDFLGHNSPLYNILGFRG